MTFQYENHVYSPSNTIIPFFVAHICIFYCGCSEVVWRKFPERPLFPLVFRLVANEIIVMLRGAHINERKFIEESSPRAASALIRSAFLLLRSSPDDDFMRIIIYG